MIMEKLIELLKDGKTRTTEMLAVELGVSMDIVRRDMDFLERTGVIKKVDTSGTCGHTSCEGCTSCSGGGKTCSGCMPEGGFQNMGSRWEVL